MAKATKKSESSARKPAKPAAAPAKPAPKTKSATMSRPAIGTPFVDTDSAAAAAARMLFAKKGDTKKAGGMIDQLKADLNKHPSASVAGILDKSALPGSKKPHLPFGPGGKQVAHNQTFSGDVTRSGVPRRTPG
jgi:hypothetical protein